jgi:hypothetical protein
VLQQAVDDAGAVEAGHDGEPAGHGGGLEAADLLHPADVQLQVRAAGGQRIQGVLGAPGQVAAQVRFGVLAGGSGEAGQVGGHCQTQLVSEGRGMIGGDGRQVGEAHHAQTLRPDSDSHEGFANAPGAA